MRRWIRNNPWVWLLLIVLFFLAANAIFLMIAKTVPPIDLVD